MAGSYNHCVDTETGKLYNNEHLYNMLDTFGDCDQAIEEMYGMIWLLAGGDASEVEHARKNYRSGIRLSPGREKDESEA